MKYKIDDLVVLLESYIFPDLVGKVGIVVEVREKAHDVNFKVISNCEYKDEIFQTDINHIDLAHNFYKEELRKFIDEI